jgi:branched-subunit amino acid aminotransferase/4-amino-4-deoxychorismate lyase
MSETRRNHRVAYFNGRFVPEREVVLPFRDRGFKYGDAAFDMTRTFHGRPFRLEEHVDRLYRSLRYLRIDPGIAPGEMVVVNVADGGNADIRDRRQRFHETAATAARADAADVERLIG